MGRKWRQQWTAADSNATAVSVGVGPKVLAACPGGAAPLPIMLYWQTPDPVGIWRQLGVDNATAAFSFCEEAPCFILGAEPEDANSAQVRLNNETKALLLLRFYNQGVPIQFSFQDYATRKGFEFPGKGILAVGEQPGVRFSIQWDEINQAGDAGLYSPEKVNSEYSDGNCGALPPVFQRLRTSFNSIAPGR
ncbi:hypothetical protein [Salidesulfovibrio onnuriiensis]|uniref:hypothetical protein n=1 Tax=Salidesulfovibrio onnuriiensis TaxID=2583823 RepID=UPI0011CCCBA2|nr:hypothetical protein [Salidesulfovibrio onnuriiensis]